MVWERRSCQRALLAEIDVGKLAALEHSEEDVQLEHVAPMTLKNGVVYMAMALKSALASRVVYYKLSSFEDTAPIDPLRLHGDRITTMFTFPERVRPCIRVFHY